ncbi:hypothetical protein HMPREF9080_02346 [Cardiobacterium valvarum F0432]|uniref:Uncharacterized protein n=1 Tax=Cardiobacterium valvarum F0432 TaxID=797473 RepID=G9ZHT8_9GAMM|nr:hypothetical protein HMPREF9080_02346 [Cardiobacterium valvarum F0432]
MIAVANLQRMLSICGLLVAFLSSMLHSACSGAFPSGTARMQARVGA